VLIGLFGLATALIAAASAVAVAIISRDTKSQSRRVNSTVSEFERAWKAMQTERAADRERITVLERREDDCLEALASAHGRIAVLEERLGVTPGE
jgi:hypothetical protein